jgi:hypothetical protein
MESAAERAAETAAYSGRLDEAHEHYLAAGRPDLALQMYAAYGQWHRVRY